MTRRLTAFRMRVAAIMAVAGPGIVAESAMGGTERVSVDATGQPIGGWSTAQAVTGDGRYVVFDNQGVIYVRDRLLGRTDRLEGIAGITPVISADGRIVAVQAEGPFLTDDRFGDVLVVDRLTGATERVRVTLSGNTPVLAYPTLSGDGRFVAFASIAPNLVLDDRNGVTDVFVHDRRFGSTERVSVDGGGGEALGTHSSEPAISGDGRLVAFTSDAGNLVVGDTNGADDVFVRDRTTGTTHRVSVGPGGRQANTGARMPAISADGQTVAFVSRATNLVVGDTNQVSDTFVYHRATSTTERVSLSSDGVQANGGSYSPVLTADGRRVAFGGTSYNTRLVPNDTNNGADIFVRDLEHGTTERASVGDDGSQMDWTSAGVPRTTSVPAISADGLAVTFTANAVSLVSDGFGGRHHVYLRGGSLPPAGPLCTNRAATIVGTPGDDALTGTPSPDVIVALGGNDTVRGRGGDDLVCGDDGGDAIDAGEGDDIVLGGDGPDTLRGTSGADTLIGGGEPDRVFGGQGDDDLWGTGEDDVLDGGGGSDLLSGGDGRDLADYQARAASLEVGIGDGRNDGEPGERDEVRADVERVRGGQGADRLLGDGGTNWLYGEAGDDELIGAAGTDWLFGQAGSDTIDSRDGAADTVYCGSALDTALADPFDALRPSCESS